jgi:hypothetical protein
MVYASDTEIKEEIVNPVVKRTVNEVTGQLATRADTLDGQTVTLYSNNKQNSDHFLKGVAQGLRDRYSDVHVKTEVVYKKRSSEPGTRWGLIEDVSEDADIVLLAYGDCGACSLYTILDAIEFERNGTPTMSYCSDKFLKLCRYDAFNEGIPGLPIVDFEHPMANLNPGEVAAERVTESLVEDTVDALVRSSEAVERDFATRYSTEDFDDRPQFDQCTI